MPRGNTAVASSNTTTSRVGAGMTVDKVSLTYSGGSQQVKALDDVTFSVEPGQFVSILGPSGCGKSTLLRLAAGFMRPSAGSITMGGLDPAAAREQGLIGIVFQSPVLLPWRSVLQNVAFLLELSGIVKSERHDRAKRYIDLVGLRNFENSRPHELSGGMQQRASIARALAFQPSVLLMDEPFGALDALTRDRMGFDLLKIWRKERKTVLFITHSVQEAVLLSDRVLVMSPRPGRIRKASSIELERPRSKDDRHRPIFVDYCRQFLSDLEAV